MSNNKNFHPVHNVYDGLFNAVSGTKIDLNYPKPEMIFISDIAAALSKICRFGGHLRQFYSVGQHSCLVSYLVPFEFRAQALLHDATEGYLGDVIKPLKVLLGDTYKEIEWKFEKVIKTRFRIKNWEEGKSIIKKADMTAVEVEQAAFQKGDFLPLMKLINQFNLSPGLLEPWPPSKAEMIYLSSCSIMDIMDFNSETNGIEL